MDPNLDLAKLVGAASAPVALIIAACIYLGNLQNKYNPLFQKIRDLSTELRESSGKNSSDSRQRGKSLHEQIGFCERSIVATMHSIFCLNLAIICFVGTVLFTAICVLLPKNLPIMMATAGLMSGGLVILAAAVVVELWSNRLAKPILDSELTGETPQYQSAAADGA